MTHVHCTYLYKKINNFAALQTMNNSSVIVFFTRSI